ncbi:MAG: hypothetical protein ACOVN5_06965 [Aquidulcibacter sp.]
MSTTENDRLKRAIYAAFRDLEMGAREGVVYTSERSVAQLSETLSAAIGAEIDRRLTAKAEGRA